ncbi:MAG: cell wall hydrolase [Clostridiales bacterium]|jgi:spore germination cell wall hydrolase CwlJ-like protein|nr:cell wall hydrolase [Bacillota bacterium]NLK02870.1 cell wall hydrolase [Clostridiales bacterium]
MNTIKKLVITLMAAFFITLSFDHVAYGTDLALADEISDDSLENVEDGANTEIADLDNVEDELNSEIIDDTSDDMLADDEFDPDLYEIFEDEQGQIYYIKKEPIEQEVVVEELEEEEVKAKTKEKPTYSKKDLRLLSSLIYAEAGNQSYKGMLAVGNVVLNRVNSKAYSHVNTVEEVIYDRKWAVQFTVTVKNKSTGKSALDKALEYYDTGKFKGKNPEAEKKAMNRAIKAAKAALSGENYIGDFLCFRVNRNTASIRKKYSYKVLGDHIFYRTK